VFELHRFEGPQQVPNRLPVQVCSKSGPQSPSVLTCRPGVSVGFADVVVVVVEVCVPIRRRKELVGNCKKM